MIQKTIEPAKKDLAEQGENGRVQKASCRRSLIRPLLTLPIFTVASLGLLVFFAHRSTQAVPEFYQAALDIAPESYREAGQELESQLLQLNTDVRNQQEWQARFTIEQVNGWLAFELPENFPGTIPPEISEPRVAFHDEKIQLAFRFVSPHFSGIVSATGNVFCTEQPNQIGIQISSLHSGMVPLPIHVWAESIKSGCANAGIDLMWSQKDGDTLAIVNLPERFLDIRDRKITLESIEVIDGQVVLAGTSLPLNQDQPSDHSRFSSSENESRQR